LSWVPLDIIPAVDPPERESMERAGAVTLQGFQVVCSPIAFVPIEAINGIKFMIFVHESVSMDLGHYGGRGYGKASPVPLRDSFLG
jgi:hypothetical protein